MRIQAGPVREGADAAPGRQAVRDDIVIIANGKVAIDGSADGIRERTGCDDLEDAFVRAIEMVEPA